VVLSMATPEITYYVYTGKVLAGRRHVKGRTSVCGLRAMSVILAA
jgi:hypothetical protein